MDASNAKIQYESGQNLVSMVKLTDQGDHKDFRGDDELWSKRAGYEPNVKPNGLATGGVVGIAASGDDDVVDVAQLTCYLAGALNGGPGALIGPQADVAIARPAGAGSPAANHKKLSITIDETGAIDVLEGDDGAAFSATRGAVGGPPWIPTTSIEIAQVWLSSVTPAAITADEIKQVVGSHCERYDYPTWTEKTCNVDSRVLGCAGVSFASALPLIHSDDDGTTSDGKEVYAEYYEPEFTDVPISSDFVPPETTHAVASKQVYGGTVGSSSSSLNQGSFTAFLKDGISDGIIGLKNELLWFKFFQNRLNSMPFVLVQGKLGIGRAFPAGDQITAACTISAEEAAFDVVG